jgi:hypothetical protein
MSGILKGLKSLVWNHMDGELDLQNTIKYNAGVNPSLARALKITQAFQQLMLLEMILLLKQRAA